MKNKFLTVLALLVLSQSAFAAPTPNSLGNLNQVKNPIGFVGGIKSGSKIFLVRPSATYGDELWISDGTEAGTTLLKDINPGVEGSSPFNFVAAKFGAEDGIYFHAEDGVNGRELWKSDGTPAGTQMVINLNGANSGIDDDYYLSSNLSIVVKPGASNAMFAANDGSGEKLWKTDGTTLGTSIIDNAFNGGAAYYPRSFYFNPINLKVYFSADANGTGREPYYTDGTSILSMGDLSPGANSSDPKSFTPSPDGSKVIFISGYYSGGKMWSFDGVSSSEITGIATSGDQSYLSALVRTDSNVIFGRAFLDESTLSFTGELYSTNGTSATLIKSLNCLPGGLLAYETSEIVPVISYINNKVVFPCLDYFNGDTQLYSSDGTAEGTKIVKEIKPGINFYSFLMPVADGKVLFLANNGTNGTEIWVSDGSAAGTKMLIDLNPKQGSLIDDTFIYLEALLYYLPRPQSGSKGIVVAGIQGKNVKILSTDGTEDNTKIIGDISGDIDGSSYPYYFTRLNNKVLFAAADTKLGFELYSSNGKKKGTKILKNIRKGASSFPNHFVRAPHLKSILFTASDGVNGQEPWITDGTKEGTHMLKKTSDFNFDQFFEGSAVRFFNARTGKKFFFQSYNRSTGGELWVTNGTKRGTKLLKDIAVGTESSDLSEMVRLGNKVIFNANDNVNGSELWISNGTSSGSFMIKDINPGSAGSEPRNFVRLGNLVLFTARTVDNGQALWATDGTSEGTFMMKEINAGSADDQIHTLTLSGLYVFFGALDQTTSGYELWRTDGTPGGTILVEDAQPGLDGSAIPEMGSLSDGKVVFSRSDATYGSELWIADYNPGSVELLKDINFGTDSSNSTDFTKAIAKKLLYFSSYDSVNGRELWVTDGTPEGTVLVADIFPGTEGSDPQGMYITLGRLFFTANNGTNGIEPYVVRLP